MRYVCVMLLKKKTFICIELAMFYKPLINENISCVRKKKELSPRANGLQENCANNCQYSYFIRQLFQRWYTIRTHGITERLRHRRLQVLHELRQQKRPWISGFKYLIDIQIFNWHYFFEVLRRWTNSVLFDLFTGWKSTCCVDSLLGIS